MIVVACVGCGGLVTHFGWRAGYVVVPVIGVIATVRAYLTVPDSRVERARRFDTVGVPLAALALICLIEGFSQVGAHGWLSPVTLGLTAAAVVLFGLFAVGERRVDEPAFLMELSASRPFVAAIVVGVVFNLGNAAVTMQYPLMVQQTLGKSAFVSSIVIAMFGVGSIGGAFGAGAFQTRRGTSDRVMFVSGLGFIAVGLLTMAFTTEHPPLWLFLATSTVIGFGVTWAQNPQSAVMMRSAPPSMVGSVGAVKPAVGQMGMGLGLGGLIPVVSSFTAAPSGTPRHAAARGFGLGMLLVAVLLVIAALIIWRMVRPQPDDRAAAVQGQGAAQRLFVHGAVITVDPARPRAEALAVTDGRITAVGDDAEIRALAGPAADVVDLRGRTVLPGFVEAHGHPSVSMRPVCRRPSWAGTPCSRRASRSPRAPGWTPSPRTPAAGLARPDDLW